MTDDSCAPNAPPAPARGGKRELADKAVKAAKPRTRRYFIWGRNGLALEVMPSGKKFFRYRYARNGQKTSISIGEYPSITLAEAIARVAEFKRLRALGGDPHRERQQAKAAQGNTFEAVARDWMAQQAGKTNAKTAADRENRLARLIFPDLGGIPIHEITTPVALQTIKKIEARGQLETAHRMLADCVQIADHAIICEVATANPFRLLGKRIKPVKVTHHAALVTPKEVGGLLRAIDGYAGDGVTRYALQLVALFFVRSSELRNMRWEAVDFKAKKWELLAGEKKEKRPLIVPLCKQAIAILRELEAITGGGTYVLGSRMGGRPLSENTLNAALRRMGFAKDQHTTHGFRSTATTMLDEYLRCNKDLIELQMGHAVRDNLGRTYNKTEKIPDRAVMMQQWADYLDELRGQGI